MKFILGEWLVACDRCGFKRLASQVTKTWDGLYVCKPSIKPGCFETRHPQDFQRAVKDDPSVEFVRKRPTDIYSPDAVYNCNALDFTYILNVIPDGTTILKSRTKGPVQIPGIVSIVCTLEIT